MNYKVLNIIMFAVMVFMNYLANAIPINGKTTGQLSAEYPNLFVPAGITFSIWGVIYLLLLAFIFLQFRESNRSIIQGISWLFAISCLLNGLWIVAWHYQQLLLSLLIMIGLLVSLILINQKFQLLPASISKAAFGIYLGWICIATIANVTAFLVSVGWTGWGVSGQTWAITMILIGAVVASITLIRLSNPFIALAVIWAFAGIMIKRQADYPSIFYVAIIGVAIVSAIVLMHLLRVGFLSKT